jgi:Spy/CpxP family protein refolding chaperone
MFGHGACGKGAGSFSGGHPFMQFLHQKAGMGGHCASPGAFLQDLDLSDEQLERIAELKIQGLVACSQTKGAMAELARQLGQELTEPKINKTKIKEIVQQLKEQKAKAGESMIDKVIAFAEALTPEQRKKVRTNAIKLFLGFNLDEE